MTAVQTLASSDCELSRDGSPVPSEVSDANDVGSEQCHPPPLVSVASLKRLQTELYEMTMDRITEGFVRECSAQPPPPADPSSSTLHDSAARLPVNDSEMHKYALPQRFSRVSTSANNDNKVHNTASPTDPLDDAAEPDVASSPLRASGLASLQGVIDAAGVSAALTPAGDVTPFARLHSGETAPPFGMALSPAPTRADSGEADVFARPSPHKLSAARLLRYDSGASHLRSSGGEDVSRRSSGGDDASVRSSGGGDMRLRSSGETVGGGCLRSSGETARASSSETLVASGGDMSRSCLSMHVPSWPWRASWNLDKTDPVPPHAKTCLTPRVQVSGFRIQGAWFRVQGSGCRVQGPGSRVEGPP